MDRSQGLQLGDLRIARKLALSRLPVAAAATLTTGYVNRLAWNSLAENVARQEEELAREA